MAWLGAAAAASSLPGCGGGGGKSLTDPVAELERYKAQQKLDEQAAASRQDGLVGVVLARLDGPDAELLRSAAGSTRLSGGRALKGNERFIIGSNTKAMTAALAALCVERGLLRWDSKPAELLPELRGQMHAGFQDLTLALLLDHLGGLMAFSEEADAMKFADFLEGFAGALPGTPSGRRSFMASWLLAQAPAAKVGQEFLYSNAGYTLAASMLEAAAGQDFELMFESLLAKPLKLDVQWRHPLGDDQPQGHVGEAASQLRAWQPLREDWQVWMDVMGPSGSANLSIAGYCEWQRLHLQAF
ncbi:serine hydrolase domain-containing protein [Pelomonas sp. SE-A7]|uniref:serine hydrolase domain-containing protein n=1 Tax=Pelomonas sp. SE-A7 TaxID=3054953 RepID=UPI00259C7668|nr:serine hydrolase domain-containing protein [Pelomonas sp. SE-A7]MDM4765067.1 serine hydrolase domain-containing protein [Pelomonas sp. SE-A7]